MPKHLLRALLPLMLVFTYGTNAAQAAIYTWTDASGRVNVSNLAPPEGTRVTSVAPESPPPTPGTSTADDAARRLEVQALADRVRQLEFEAQFAQRQPPPPVATYQSPPVASYQMPQVQYSEFPPAYADASDSNCNPAWAGCGNWWSPFGYPTIVVLQAPGFHRPRPIQGGHRPPIQQPMRPFGVAYRR